MPVTLSTGIFSGLDTRSIIDQMLALERQPIGSLQLKKSTAQAKISALGTLKAAISDLKTSLGNLKDDTVFSMKVTSGSESVFKASAKSTAAEGEHSIKVRQLAVAQTLVSRPFAASNSEVADLTTYSTQKLKLTVGSSSKEISITSSNNKISDLADAINDSGLGVSATLVDAGFEVTAANNTLVFNDGSDRTATLTAGTYTANELADEIKRAMEAANGGSDTYTVSYDTSTLQFKIANDTGNSNSIDLLFEHASTTVEDLLGFTATDHAAVAAGSSLTSDSTVGSQRLILSSTQTGTANRLVLQTDEDNDGTYDEAADTDATGLSRFAFNPEYDSAGAVLSGTANLTQTQAAVDAKFDFDGLTITRGGNSVSDLLSGVTIDLVSVNTTTSYLLKIEKNLSSVTSHVSSFVSAYNAAAGLARSLSANSEKNKNVLSGDAVARGLVSDLRENVVTRYGDYSLATLGLSHSKDGVLALDSSVLEGFLESDFDGSVATLNDLAEDMETQLQDFLDKSIPARTEGLNSEIERYDDKIAAITRRASLQEEQLIRTFSNLEQIMGQLQSSGDFLAQHLATLTSSS